MGGKRAREGIKFLQLAVSRYSGIKFLRMCVFVVVTVNNGPTSPSLYNPFPGVLWILLRFQSFLKKSHSLAILITGVRNLVLFHTDRDREKQSRREESRKLWFWEGNCTNLLGSQERVVTHNRSYRIKSLQRSVIKVHAKSLISKQTILWLRKECRLDGKHPPPPSFFFFSSILLPPLSSFSKRVVNTMYAQPSLQNMDILSEKYMLCFQSISYQKMNKGTGFSTFFQRYMINLIFHLFFVIKVVKRLWLNRIRPESVLDTVTLLIW